MRKPKVQQQSDAREWLLAFALFGVVLIAYSPALTGGILWDDAGHITRPDLQSLNGLRRIWFELGATQQYYPVLHTLFWIEHKLWGASMLGYHLANAALHAAAALLAVAVLRRLAHPAAWLAGFIFALHPVCVESAAWITEQKNTLSAVFYLAAALVYLRFDEVRRREYYLAALGLFTLALLSKTVTATLPAALLVILWWKHGRLDWKRDVAPLAPWLALGIAAGLYTAWVEREVIGARGSDFSLSLIDRCLLAGRVLWFYVFKLIAPVNLMFVYPRWTVDSGSWTQWLFPMGAIGAAAALWWLRARSRTPLAAFLFFAGTLFPALGFFDVYPFRFSYVADHFQYLASLGVIAPLCAIRIPRAAGIAVAGALGVLTWTQAAIYRDAEALYTETIARNPDCWMCHMNLGLLYTDIPGRMLDARAEFEAAVKIKPDYAEARRNLGLALADIPGNLPEAIAQLEQTVRARPGYAEAHVNLGTVLLRSNRPDDAARSFEAALRISPNWAAAHLGLGAIHSMRKQPDLAIAEYRAAIALRPDDADARLGLAAALVDFGRANEAIPEYQAALRARPDSAEAHYNLGTVLMDIPSRLPEAIPHLERATQLAPGFGEAHLNLGIALSQFPERRAEAIRHLETALAGRPDLAPARALLDRLRN